MAGRATRVAVLDDDPAFRALVDAVLGDQGYRTQPLDAADDDPVEMVVATQPNLVILDLHGVGGRDGLDVLHRLRSDPRTDGLPILLSSGDVRKMRQAAAELSRLPRVAALEKPFGIETLIGTVEALLEGASTFPPEGGRPDPAAIVELLALLGRIGRTLRWPIVDAWVPDRRPGLLRCAAAWTAAVQLEPFAEASRRTRLPVGAGLPGRSWMSRRAAWVEHLEADTNFPRHGAAQRVHLVSAAAVPVIDAGEVLGIVAGYDTRRRRPSAAALDRLRRFTAGSEALLRNAAGPADTRVEGEG